MPRAPKPVEDQFARIAAHYDALMFNVPYGLWADYIGQLALLSGRPIWAGSKLLDLATGTGSIALEFAERGCHVTGLDISAPMIAEAKRKAAARELDVSFICADLTSFHLPAEFDHAVCVYDSLNYIRDVHDLERAFANIRRALKPGGLFIFDVNTVRALEAELFTQTSRPDAPVRYQWRSKYNPRTRTSRIKMDFAIVETGEKFTIVQRQRAYTDAELRSLLHRSGFGAPKTYAAYGFQQPGPDSDRTFYVTAAEGEALDRET
jgi:ubiquinone/menaquinone biosynthesis C-methylase UbiE